jgi:hypothetical protein
MQSFFVQTKRDASSILWDRYGIYSVVSGIFKPDDTKSTNTKKGQSSETMIKIDGRRDN